MTSVSASATGSSNAWKSYDYDAQERREVTAKLDTANAKIAAARPEYDAAKAAYESMQSDMRAESNRGLAVAGAAAVSVGAAVGFAAFKLHAGIPNALAAAGISMGLAGITTMLSFPRTHHDTAGAARRYATAARDVGDQETQARFSRGWIEPDPGPDWPTVRNMATNWDARRDSIVDDTSIGVFAKDVIAPFDHNGDGAIDISDDSDEHYADAINGGRISSNTKRIDYLYLQIDPAQVDANGDKRITPGEVVTHVVDREFKEYER